MEVWASNLEIESKGALESPYQIRYWQGAPARTSAPVLADTQTPSNTNQANLNMNTEPEMDELAGDFEDPAQNVAAIDEPNFDAGALEEPVIEDEFSNELDQDLAAVGSIEEPPSDLGGDTFNNNNNQAGLDQGFDGEITDNDPLSGEAATNPETNPRNVALNNAGGGFPSQKSGGIQAIMNDPGQMGVIGAALLVLLGLGFIVIRRRRASAEEAIEMESFDFGGETVIEDEVNKTQVDI